MKAFTAASAMLLLLLLALCSPAFSAPVGSDVPTSCCFGYMKKKIPRNLVARYYETNSQCALPALVFVTKKDRELCANPAEPWVKQYVNFLDSN